MNIYSIIKQSLAAINSLAALVVLEKSRDENNELEYSGDTIVIYPTWTTTNNQILGGGELVKTSTFQITFKSVDEYDNSDNDDNDYGKSSVSIISAMEALADSVFFHIYYNIDNFEGVKSLEWKMTRPILRENNGTMSGVRIQLTMKYTGTIICDYEQL